MSGSGDPTGNGLAPFARLVARAVVPMGLCGGDGFTVLASSDALDALVRAPLSGRSLTHAFPRARDLHGILATAAGGEGAAASFTLDALGVGLGPAASDTDDLWEWVATPIVDEGGAVAGILLSAADVAGRRETEKRIEVLEGLVYLSRRLSGAEGESEIHGVLSEDIGRLLGAGGCVILRLDYDASRDPEMRVVRPMLPGYGVPQGGIADTPMRVRPETTAWRVVVLGETFATDDIEADPSVAEYKGFFRRLGAHSGLTVPIRLRGETLGVLVVFNKPGGFSARDVATAEVFAAEAALAIENARLFDQEHRIASALQEALLPGPMPHMPHADLAALYRPAGHIGSVGGDFYDVFQIDDDHYALLLGDVSGKGPEAAAQTALVRHMARGLAMNETQPGPVLAELNYAVWKDGLQEHFITVLYGVYQPSTRQLQWGNAGHPAPLLWRRGEGAKPVGESGLALGIMPRADIRIDRMELAPGDIVVWYTDGLIEAHRPGQMILGTAPLLRALEGAAERSVGEVADALFRRAAAHCGNLSDDVAVLVVLAR